MRRRSQRGLTLIELIVAFTIMMLLTSMAVPLARVRVRFEKERALKFALREMRQAIDQYNEMAEKGMLGPPKAGTENYPETLDVLVEGVKLANQAEKKVKLLRRIPKDPLTNSTEWGRRSTQDDPKSLTWGGQNVFDVYSKSLDRARDGTPYAEW